MDEQAFALRVSEVGWEMALGELTDEQLGVAANNVVVNQGSCYNGLTAQELKDFEDDMEIKHIERLCAEYRAL